MSGEAHDFQSGDKELDRKIKEWLHWDKNEKTRTEVAEAAEKQEWSKLKKVMLGRLKFGTAGLRGPMKAGFMCMNDVVVLQSAQGLCEYLKKTCSKYQLQHGVVVGFDGRYNSKRFSELTAKVFVSSGIRVYLFSKVCPTPFIPYTIMKFGCIAGVMVTASHNPKEDNGYKVYWGNGTQIITPHDDNILSTILDNLVIPEEHWDVTDIRSHKLVSDPLIAITSDYVDNQRVDVGRELIDMNATADLDITYSAMHGVGYCYVEQSFKKVGLKPLNVVEEQKLPDPEFPTVKFPNPEEPQCLELSKKLADQVGSNLVLANDPDADRLAVAEKNNGEWKILNGNDIGTLLGWWILHLHKERHPEVPLSSVYLLCSGVSSKMIKSIANSEGCNFSETLTGFKWMGNKSVLLLADNKWPIFAFEEAIGFMCGPRVLDKDGVSAAVQVATLASYLKVKHAGRTLMEHMNWLYDTYGYHVSDNSYYFCHDPAVIQKIFNKFRHFKNNDYPKVIGEWEISSIQDLAVGVFKVLEEQNGHCERGEDEEDPRIGTGLDLPYTTGEMVTITFKNGMVATIRTSGTEPKIKYYTELCAPVHMTDRDEINSLLKKMVEAIVENILQPNENGLIPRS